MIDRRLPINNRQLAAVQSADAQMIEFLAKLRQVCFLVSGPHMPSTAVPMAGTVGVHGTPHATPPCLLQRARYNAFR